MKSIKDIEIELAGCPQENLEELFAELEADSRSGVKKLVEKKKKEIERLKAEYERTAFMYTYEKKYGDEFRVICGIDEVGRGPLAGPVYAAAVILPRDHEILYLNDSKQLSAAKREELSRIILQEAVSVGIGYADNNRIDEINILQATFEAMRLAVSKLDPSPELLLNDAVIIPQIPEEKKQIKIIKGDACSASIAAASIVAKVERDRIMDEMDELYPGYGFASNKGYGSAEHIAALKKLGPTPIHRRSFISNFID